MAIRLSDSVCASRFISMLTISPESHARFDGSLPDRCCRTSSGQGTVETEDRGGGVRPLAGFSRDDHFGARRFQGLSKPTAGLA